MNQNAIIFNKNGYLIVKKFIQPPLLQVLHRYVLMKSQNGQLSHSDKQVPGAPSLYADTLMETLMELVMPQVENITERELFPTYSYFRIYKEGDILRPHIDRPSCEVSFSICLGYDVSNVNDASYCWPIHVDNSCDFRSNEAASRKSVTEDDGMALKLAPGDCVIYKGCEVRHWRNKFLGNYQAQAFIHYVDKNGPYAKYKFDTRPLLGATADKIIDTGPYSYFPE